MIFQRLLEQKKLIGILILVLSMIFFFYLAGKVNVGSSTMEVREQQDSSTIIVNEDEIENSDGKDFIKQIKRRISNFLLVVTIFLYTAFLTIFNIPLKW